MSGSSSSHLRRYLLRRLFLAVPMFLVLTTMVFLLMRVIPGDPVTVALGGHVPKAELEELREEGGYNRPLPAQYVAYLGDMATFDYGRTTTDNRSVTEVIRENGAASLELTGAAMLVAVLVGIPLGLIAARRRDSPRDIALRGYGIVIYAVPIFFLGLLAQLVFSRWLGWLPASGRASPDVTFELSTHTNLFLLDAAIDGNWPAFWDVLRHLILPATTLGLVISGVFLRMVRVNMLQTLRSGYVEAAQARGLRERRVVVSHAFKNALVPVVTIVGLQMALLFSGAVLTERTFNWPGLGSQLIDYLNNRDYTAVQGIISFYAILVVAVSLTVDVVIAWIDPRVRY